MIVYLHLQKNKYHGQDRRNSPVHLSGGCPTADGPVEVGRVECYLRNELSSQIMAGYVDVGGARVEILESDVPRAMKIMEEGGYDLPREDEQAEPVEQVAGFARHIPFLRKYPLEKQIMILFVIIAVFLALVIYFGSLISSN